MRKKFVTVKLLIVVVIVVGVCIAGIYIILVPKKVSKVIVKETTTIERSTTTVEIVPAIAELPKKQPKKYPDFIDGKIVDTFINPAEPTSKKMIVLEDKNNELIVLTNIPYVNTLRKMYFNKQVKLGGHWRKDVIIYGKRYKSFWVEDFELLK